MAETPRIATVDSNRATTDKTGETIVLGNSIFAGAVSMSSALISSPNGAATGSAAFFMDPDAALLIGHLSSGTQGADFTMAPAMTGAPAGAAIGASAFDSDAAETLTGHPSARGYVLGGRGVNFMLSNIELYNMLTETRSSIAALNSSVRRIGSWTAPGHGYVGGGNTDLAGNNFTNEIERFTYETQVTTTIAATIGTSARAGIDGTNHFGNLRGYISGGEDNVVVYDAIRRITMTPTETSTLLSAVLAVARADLGSWSTTTKGYWVGGANLDESTVYQRVDGITFSSEAEFDLGGKLLDGARTRLATIHSATRGYAAGGLGSAGGFFAAIDGLEFDGDASINPSATLSAGRIGMAGFHTDTKGYWVGGTSTNDPVNITDIIERFTYSSETRATQSAALVTPRRDAAGLYENVL